MANLAQVCASTTPVLTMQDDLGITYLIGSAQQFWSGRWCKPELLTLLIVARLLRVGGLPRLPTGRAANAFAAGFHFAKIHRVVFDLPRHVVSCNILSDST